MLIEWMVQSWSESGAADISINLPRPGVTVIGDTAVLLARNMMDCFQCGPVIRPDVSSIAGAFVCDGILL